MVIRFYVHDEVKLTFKSVYFTIPFKNVVFFFGNLSILVCEL